MKFTVLNWNLGGAKFFEQKEKQRREEVREKINCALNRILTDRAMGPEPDVVTLQEIVRWREPTDTVVQDLLYEIPGYDYYPFPLIDSDLHSSKAKWNKIKDESDWHPDTYFAQGNAFLIKENAPHFPIWDLSNLEQPKPGNRKNLIELVRLDSGLYFGDRNTEPRAALVAHFIYDPDEGNPSPQKMPLDIFVVNLHLTTLMMEREGVPEIDARASKIRQDQLCVVFNGIVSRYNSWRRNGYRERSDLRESLEKETFERHSPIWIISGDFNFTEESAEYTFIERMNFLDTVPEEGKKTRWGNGTKAKGVGNDPTLTLDYVFAGPKFISFDHAISIHQNRVIHDHKLRASDHYPILSSFDILDV